MDRYRIATGGGFKFIHLKYKTMKVKATRDFITDISMKEGEVKDLAPDRAAYFISVGLAKEVKAETKKTDDKKGNKPAAKKVDALAADRVTKEEKTDKEDK